MRARAGGHARFGARPSAPRGGELKVAHVAYAFAPVGPDAVGGTEQVVSALERTAAAEGDPPLVIASSDSVVAGELVPISRPTGPIDARVRRRIRAEQRAALERVLAEGGVDVVHMHGLDFAEVLPPGRSPVPVLVTLHLPPEWYAPGALARCAALADYVCVSESQHRSLARELPLLAPVPNGVPVDALRSSVRKRRYLVALGRICPEKGFEDALDAAHHTGRPLLLAGEVFPYAEHQAYFAREIAPRLGVLRRFVGPVGFRRKRRLLSGASCLLVPSRAPETSSLVAMEALACGTPVVAYPSGALAEVVEHGLTGFLVRDVREMADAIEEAHRIDPRVCREVARERFSLERMVDGYRDRYREVVARRGGEPADSGPRADPPAGVKPRARESADPRPRTRALRGTPHAA